LPRCVYYVCALWGRWLDLLSARLTIPLVCCHIKSFRRASRCGEAMARRRKEERQAGLASRGMCSAGVVAPPVCGHWGVPARGVVPARCHTAGSAVDARRDTIAGVRRAARAADGGVVDVPRVLPVSPRAPRMTAPRVARCDPYKPMVLVSCILSNFLVSYKLNSAIERGTKPDALGWKPCHWTSTLKAAMVNASRA
jgi:hypothetical protein